MKVGTFNRKMVIPARAGLAKAMARALGVLVVALFALLLQEPAFADGLGPVIAKGKGDKCVEDTAVMRRTHMDLLKHQRDATMRLGIRTTRHSLKECVSCHAVPGKDGKPVTVADSQHFCASCHSFAGVRPDCFECHSSVPEAKDPKQKLQASSQATLGQTAPSQGRGQ